MADNNHKDDDADDNYSNQSGVFTFESKLSPAYVQFTIDNKSKYLWWNLGGMCANAALGYLSVFIINTHPNECAGIKLASWSLFSLYIVTFLLQAACLCGLEKKFCSSMGLLAVLVYDLVVITWAQVTYFQS